MPTIRPEDFFATIREWQWIKHLILSDYLWPWAMKVGSTSAEIYVVDAFAGAGRYRTRDGEMREGSPVIAARRARQYQGWRPAGKMRVICVERSPANYRQLVDHLAPFGNLVRTLPGDFHDHIGDILSTIGPAPAVILLDPIGLKAITADRCRELIHRAGKTDLFVIVHFGIVHRAAGQLLPDGSANRRIAASGATTRNVDAFFGTREWRRIALDPTLEKLEKEDAYLRLYWQSVLGERYRFKSAYAVRPELDGTVKYWLVHACDHEDPYWLMNDAIVKVDQLLLRRKYERPGELPGVGEALTSGALEDAARERSDALLREIPRALKEAGGSMTFYRLKWQIAPRHFGEVTQGAYGKAVRSLVKTGAIRRQDRLAAAFRDDEEIRLSNPGDDDHREHLRPQSAARLEQLTLFG